MSPWTIPLVNFEVYFPTMEIPIGSRNDTKWTSPEVNRDPILGQILQLWNLLPYFHFVFPWNFIQLALFYEVNLGTRKWNFKCCLAIHRVFFSSLLYHLLILMSYKLGNFGNNATFQWIRLVSVLSHRIIKSH